jgi:hypothetical protein
MRHRGAKQCIETLALALELSKLVNSTNLRWLRVYLPLKLYVVDVDDQYVA